MKFEKFTLFAISACALLASILIMSSLPGCNTIDLARQAEKSYSEERLMDSKELEEDWNAALVEDTNAKVGSGASRSKRDLRRRGRRGGSSWSFGSKTTSTGQVYYAVPIRTYGYYYNGVGYSYGGSGDCHPDDAQCIAAGKK